MNASTEPALPAPPDPATARIAVIGLGYVGLPLAVEFAGSNPVLGFDINTERVAELREGNDRTLEVPNDSLRAALDGRLALSADPADLAGTDVFIVTVPTPIDTFRRPDLGPLESASHLVGAALRPGAVVVYESTVYPGATEEVCAPILAAESGLELNVGFWLGYSPERINPGDHAHRLPDILKVTSGSTPAAADFVDALYARVITAGTHKASSIRVAEAAKVIENTQRDVNIALINELAVLFNTLGIDTTEVLEAAGTKWNFLGFRPGLVGGHCIGVDPYYLTHKAQEVGHHPEVILAGRRINDRMGGYVAEQTVRALAQARRHVAGARVLVLGLAFKENCPDLRNTRVVDIVAELGRFGVEVDVLDPWVDAKEAEMEYGITLVDSRQMPTGTYDAVVLAVAHEQFTDPGFDVRAWLAEDGLVYDVKGALPAGVADARL
ncbi:MAG: nucleotide sugar dehydrogenase [Actinobacteria bacterium]|nr:nucleotide sugar dehydrogenase [Actinomycetota bacterium]